MRADQKSHARALAAFVVISLAVVGYFTGLQSPMKAPQSEPPLDADSGDDEPAATAEAGVIPATSYTQLPEVLQVLRSRTLLSSLHSAVNPLKTFTIDPAETQLALQQRDQNRAYNGAPPTIPHPIDQLSDASCIACHGAGMKTASLRISRMSHQFLTNCTQCHVESNPRHAEPIEFRENEFDGIDAPEEGPRAFVGAPPQIPHSIWMRLDCMSCHGYSGLQGIRTTHPWRNNCQQCHAPSAEMDQTFPVAESRFLQDPNIVK